MATKTKHSSQMTDDELADYVEALDDPSGLTRHDGAPLRAIARAAAASAAADETLAATVDAARAAGLSWTAIGAVLGVSRQAVHKRFGTDQPGPVRSR